MHTGNFHKEPIKQQWHQYKVYIPYLYCYYTFSRYSTVVSFAWYDYFKLIPDFLFLVTQYTHNNVVTTYINSRKRNKKCLNPRLNLNIQQKYRITQFIKTLQSCYSVVFKTHEYGGNFKSAENLRLCTQKQ